MKISRSLRKKFRIRNKLKKVSKPERFRLSISRSSKNISAQIIDDLKQTILKINGADKQQVGMVASKIKSFRPPEPYKGKGIKELGQYILRKEGKKK